MSLGDPLKQNDSTIYTRWASDLSSDYFQMRLGSERALTFAVIKDLWVGHSANLIDKPQQHIFAKYLEYDISGANMTESIRRFRKSATRVLGKPLWPKYYPLPEPYSVNLTKALLKNGKNGKNYLGIYNSLWQIVFDLNLSLIYSTNSSGVDDSFTNGLVACINQISEYRASTQREPEITSPLFVFSFQISPAGMQSQWLRRFANSIWTSSTLH
jgi:phenylacetate 2-hydroxylase